MTIEKVKCVHHPGLMIDENLYWNIHIECVYNSQVKYFCISEHIKTFVLKELQNYFVFIHPRIIYGIEVFVACFKEHLKKSQVIQNRLLKLLLKFGRRTPIDLLHGQLSLLKFTDFHGINILSFANEGRSERCPVSLLNYPMYQWHRWILDKTVVTSLAPCFIATALFIQTHGCQFDEPPGLSGNHQKNTVVSTNVIANVYSIYSGKKYYNWALLKYFAVLKRRSLSLTYRSICHLVIEGNSFSKIR